MSIRHNTAYVHPLTLILLAVTSVLTLVGPHEPGIRLRLTGSVHDGAGHPVAGAVLHVYQTDATGRYTPDRPMDEPHARLAGRTTTDASGNFEIRTIRPGGYAKAVPLAGQDRHIPAHIHIDVTATNHRERRMQVVFSDDPLLEDPYWKQWVERLRQPVVSVTPDGAGLSARLIITLD